MRFFGRQRDEMADAVIEAGNVIVMKGKRGTACPPELVTTSVKDTEMV